MIDIHCHILPGVDDGSKDADMTRKLLEMSKENGITDFVATPHMEGGIDGKRLKKIKEAFDTAAGIAREVYGKANIYLGCEIMYSSSVADELVQGKLLTMNGTEYVLVEFPVFWEYKAIKEAVKTIKYAGFIPILAHVERYIGTADVENVEKLVNAGALIQVNSSTLCGEIGLKKKWYAFKLMKMDLVHFVATDMHRIDWRKPEIAKAVKVIDKKFGKEYRDKIMIDNQKKLISGEQIL